jgi:2'-5' RNA ligase
MAFMGIRVPHETGRLLAGIEVPGKKVAVSELHITLLYFGENWPVSEISKALEATYQVVSRIKPFMVKAQRMMSFPGHDNSGSACIIRAESDELHTMRKKLAKEFDKQEIQFDKTYKTYKPHITLSYADKEIEETELESPIEFPVQEVVLWGGDHGDDRIFVTFPLQGPKKQKNAVLIQKAEIFYKIASNPRQEFLIPTKERRKIER